MNIQEFADITRMQIVITYYPNQKGRWSAQFEGAEVKDGSILIGEYGSGQSPAEALDEYIKSIRGKLLVKGAHTDTRSEYMVPESLTWA